jgi:aminoglycoside 6'-N-acetyltransferase I
LASRYGLQIRAATPADAEGVAVLMASAGHPVSAAVLAERLEAIRRSAGTALLALEWGPPSGVIVLNWFDTLGADGRVAQITALLVGPEERRRGIARLLLKAGAQAARSAGCGTLHLLVSGGEPGLAEFGRASGFDPAGTVLARPLRKGPGRADEG